MTNQTITITAETKNQRLDKFLADFDASRSRAAWQKAIKGGQIRVNGASIAPDYGLKSGDQIELLLEEGIAAPAQAMIPNIPVLYEDRDVIVMDKPIGVIAQRAASSSAPAVTDFLAARYPGIEEVGKEEGRSGLVHRLDKDTSGLLLAAKTPEAFAFLKAEFQERRVRKIYTALAYGKVEPSEGEVDLLIGRNPQDPCRQTAFRPGPSAPKSARPARTLYRTLRAFPGFTLLSVELKTGRMHQIRVHLKALGHPVAGDPKYAPQSLLQKTPELERQFLHASELEIRLPSGKMGRFTSPLPSDLAAFLQKLSDLD
jgi:23S rRNA pseudouridine1911/1915/1917 synthase